MHQREWAQASAPVMAPRDDIRLDIIRGILDDSPMIRYQDPAIEISAGKRPYYFVRAYVMTVEGNSASAVRRRLRLGYVSDFKTQYELKQAKQAVMAQINQGKFVIQAQIPFAGILKRYQEVHIPTLGEAVQGDYRQKIAKHVEPFFGRLATAAVTGDLVQQWINSKKDLSWWSRKGLIYILSGIFTQAKTWKLWTGDNPCEHIKIGSKDCKREKKLLRADGFNAFLNAIPDTRICSVEAARLIVITAITSGCRVSEALGIQPRDIDPELDGGTLRIARGWRRGFPVPTKSAASKRSRKIEGLATRLMIFSAGKASDEYIFGRADRAGNPPDDRDLQQHVFRPAAERAGIYFEGFGMHTFRRMNITWRQTLGGATVFEAQKAAGHAQPSTTWDYTITDDERERVHVRAILDQIDWKASTGESAPEANPPRRDNVIEFKRPRRK